MDALIEGRIERHHGMTENLKLENQGEGIGLNVEQPKGAKYYWMEA